MQLIKGVLMKNATTMANSPQYPMPLVRVDVVLFSVQEAGLHVMLSQRQEAPHKGLWGLPGGVLRTDRDLSLEAAARRVAMERLEHPINNLMQVVAVGGADRDPRAAWAMTVVYASVVPADIPTSPGKRVQALAWRPVDSVLSATPLAFDHKDLIGLAAARVRQEVRDLRFPTGSVPQTFTLPELQAFSEGILGESLDKVTFRRRIEAAQLLEPVPGAMRGGAHRPAQVYRWR